MNKAKSFEIISKYNLKETRKAINSGKTTKEIIEAIAKDMNKNYKLFSQIISKTDDPANFAYLASIYIEFPKNKRSDVFLDLAEIIIKSKNLEWACYFVAYADIPKNVRKKIILMFLDAIIKSQDHRYAYLFASHTSNVKISSKLKEDITSKLADLVLKSGGPVWSLRFAVNVENISPGTKEELLKIANQNAETKASSVSKISI